MAGNFTAQVSEAIAQSKVAIEAVFKEAAQRVILEMNTTIPNGGNVPVDTGFLWHSLQVSTAAMPQIDQSATNPGHTPHSFDSGQVSLVINGATLETPIFAGYTAAYAPAQNYGRTDAAGNSHAGHLFVEKAAQRWEQIVKQVEAELVQRVNAP